MLEVLREYKHLSAQKKRDGELPGALEARLSELEALVRAERERRGGSASVSSADLPAQRSSDSLAAQPLPRGSSRSSRADLPAQSSRADLPAQSSRSDLPAQSSRSDLPAQRAPSRAPSRARRAAPAQRARSKVAPKAEEAKTADVEKKSWLSDPQNRRKAMWAAAIVSLLLCPLSTLVFGVPFDLVTSSLLPYIAVFSVVGWALFYPALMWWRERAARNSTSHLNEPDFVARAPVVEPVVAVLTGLGAVTWLIMSDFADQGLARTVGFLLGMTFGLVGSGLVAILVMRPIARRRTAERAYDQYLEAGTFQLNKNNAKRAHRLFERALESATTEAQEAKAKAKLEEAIQKEAADLESRGYAERAKQLRRAAKKPKKPSRELRKSDTSTGSTGAAAPMPTTPPRLLRRHTKIDILGPNTVPTDPAELAEVREAAVQLERRGRNREAFEALVDGELALTASLAREAANEYIGAGLLRSADVIYERLGERQIPEFYKAVAVEWSRADAGFEPKEATRLASILWELSEGEAAVRVAAQGALSQAGDDTSQREAAMLAEKICGQLSMSPPPEIVERLGRFGEAADLYNQAGRREEAERCLKGEADRLLEAEIPRPKDAIPVLSKLFSYDKYLEDKYLGPLVEYLMTTRASGGLATRALAAYRHRHRDDHRVSTRLTEMYIESNKRDEALAELDHLEKLDASAPQALVEGYQRLRNAYPQDATVASGLARALVRAGKPADATGVVRDLLGSAARSTESEGLIQLIDGLFEWGRSDIELRRERALLNLERGDTAAALEDFEQYVIEGGRDPEAIRQVVELLRGSLALANGSPDYVAHMRLARFHLFSGQAPEALSLLEIARTSDETRDEADVLLGRAELAASNPRRAVQVLRDAIAGRHPQDTPELHFELARAFEMLGDLSQAKKVDAALEHFVPGFVEDYLKSRPAFDRADTIFMPGKPGALDDTTNIQAKHDTDDLSLPDVGDDDFEDEETRAQLDLSDVLLPRYRLLKRLGSGGMGDVHLAEDLALGREVAIKVLRRSLATDLFIAKFKEEARIVAKLSHPGIVGVYDIGQRGEWSYIVMEYVPGPDLATLVHASMPPTTAEIADTIAQVADAMEYAHGQGVIHRDLKPANILVTTDGTAKVTDFGIARVLQVGSDETAFSAAGLQVGTVNYMAPEQIQGATVGPKTDIYLLGTTLYYSLTRQYPYVGDAVVVQKIRQDAIPVTRHRNDLSPQLAQSVTQAIARKPEDRFENMGRFARALRTVPEVLEPSDETELL